MEGDEFPSQRSSSVAGLVGMQYQTLEQVMVQDTRTVTYNP